MQKELITKFRVNSEPAMFLLYIAAIQIVLYLIEIEKTFMIHCSCLLAFACFKYEIRNLSLLFIPLIIYHLETKQSIIGFIFILVLLYIAICFKNPIQRDIKTIRWILVSMIIFKNGEWYILLLTWVFLYITWIQFKQFQTILLIKTVLLYYIYYSDWVPYQIFEYKRIIHINHFDTLIIVHSFVVSLIHPKLDTRTQIYIYTAPLWPLLFIINRSDIVIIEVLANIIQIVQFLRIL